MKCEEQVAMAQKWLKRLAYRAGYDFTFRRMPQYDLKRKEEKIPRDMEDAFVDAYDLAKAFTMTSVPRMYALYQAVRYVVEQSIEGDFVECGVWRGGSCMLMAHTLKALGDTSRTLYLYDTFTGMTRPSEHDIRKRDRGEQITRWEASQREGYNEWAYAPIDEVRENLRATGYPDDKLVFVAGEVQTTLPETIPERVALLRLDTDWYESTYHEMVHLYPRLAHKGMLILDDYGSFEGARRAVDQYFAENQVGDFLSRIDATGRLAIKLT
jgi:hypothetical protein